MLPLIQNDVRLTLWGWIGLSLAMHVLTRLLIWRLRHPLAGRLGRWTAFLRQSPLTPWFASFARVAYFILIPYSLLLQGIINDRWMGLSNLDWPRSFGIGIPIALGAIVLLSVAVWYYRRTTRQLTPFPRSEVVAQPWGWAALLPSVVFQEVHWAFYRSGTLALGIGMYWGVFGSLVIIGLEQALDPFFVRDSVQPSRSLAALFPMILALLSAVWFYFIANLWMGILLHWSVEWVVLQIASPAKPQGQ